MSGPRPLIYSAFNEFVVSHHDHGLWNQPGSRQLEIGSVDYWVDVARTLERANFDLLFFADVLAPYDLYRGSRDAAIASAMQIPVNDPAQLIPVLAYATENLGFALTQNLLQEHPYAFARKMSTMDQLSGGRIAWNIVTSFLPGAGRNLGFGGLPTHEERYGRADDFVDVVYKLWEDSWEDGAVVADRGRQRYADPAKVHTIDHVGPYYDVVGPHLTAPSPQRTPVLFQAAASSVGIDFAGRNAEILFTSFERQSAAASIEQLRGAAEASGRSRDDVKIFAAFSFVLGSTEAEAQRLAREAADAQSLESILVKYSGFWGMDLDLFPLDARIADLLEAGRGTPAAAYALRTAPDASWSFERFIRWFANQHTVGTPEQIADEIERWRDVGIDGLNIPYIISPGTYDDLADHLTPLLQRRGLMASGYREGTLREKLFGRGPYLPDTHPARRTRRWAR
ncbi:NtaA/DmoA family FMN-dependent monooxygenase [Microbacterium sp. NPDC089189]|uniref:NtaA/DmoA family FMN-dependent monooxygenase n=1 Tax=Microbacterium sp. NPDC089189 TaxID=3154972 RepID=UPI00343CCD62